MAPPSESGIEHTPKSDEIIRLLLLLDKLTAKPIQLFIHPIYIPLEKDLIYGSPYRKKPLSNRLLQFDEECIPHPDALKGMQDEDTMRKEDFKPGTSKEEIKFMSQYYCEAK